MNRYRFTMGAKVLYTYGRTLLAAREIIGVGTTESAMACGHFDAKGLHRPAWDKSSWEGDLAPKRKG